MSWAETAVVLDDVNKVHLNPAPVRVLYYEYNISNDILSINLGINDVIISSAKQVRTNLIEVWRRKGAPISEYGEGTKITTLTRDGEEMIYEDDYSSLDRDDFYYYGFFSIGNNSYINKIDFESFEFDSENPGFAVYGFKETFSIADSSPNGGRITYPDTVVDDDNPEVIYNIINRNYIPMHNESDHTESGSFKPFLTKFLNNKPWMVNFETLTGEYELDPLDYTKKLNGNDSDFANPNYNGGPFAWIDKIYTKEIYRDGARYVLYTKNPNSVNYGFTPAGFLNPANEELKGLWLPMLFLDSNYKSAAGVNIFKSSSVTVGGVNTAINNLNSGAKIFGGPIRFLLRDLLFMLFRTTNIKTYIVNDLGDRQEMLDVNGDVNIHIKGSGYTYKSRTTYDPNSIGFQISSTMKLPSKVFHSFVFGNCCMILDPYLRMKSGGSKNVYFFTTDRYIYNETGTSHDEGIYLYPYDANDLYNIDNMYATAYSQPEGDARHKIISFPKPYGSTATSSTYTCTQITPCSANNQYSPSTSEGSIADNGFYHAGSFFGGRIDNRYSILLLPDKSYKPV